MNESSPSHFRWITHKPIGQVFMWNKCNNSLLPAWTSGIMMPPKEAPSCLLMWSQYPVGLWCLLASIFWLSSNLDQLQNMFVFGEVMVALYMDHGPWPWESKVLWNHLKIVLWEIGIQFYNWWTFKLSVKWKWPLDPIWLWMLARKKGWNIQGFQALAFWRMNSER